MTDFEKFIIDNADADIARLMLSNKKWPVPEDFNLGRMSSKDVAVNTIEARKKLRKKVPEWWEHTSLVYPTTLCAEQCSSSATAAYKAELARKIIYEYADKGSGRLGTATTHEDNSAETGSGHQDAAASTNEVHSANTTTSRQDETVASNEDPLANASHCEHIIADLAGGLGVDAAAFAKVADTVLYNEMNPVLAEAARHNFSALGINNIRISCKELTSQSLPEILRKDPFDSYGIGNWGKEDLETIRPDIIYLDPSRRGSNGNRFYNIEDCQPNVMQLMPAIFTYSRNMLLKLSPMADITLVVQQLNKCFEEYSEKAFHTGWNGNWIREIHIVSIGGECKEMLVWMDSGWTGDITYYCSEDGNILTFSQEEIAKSKATLPDSTYMKIIFEPGKSITKAGASNAVCNRFGLTKLGKFTHLYTFSQPLTDAEAAEKANMLKPYGKIFKVKEVLHFDKASIKAARQNYPHSEVSAKNIPIASDELRSRLGVASGDDAMIFGARIETPASSGNYLIICERIQ
jgi:hypothetical protein